MVNVLNDRPARAGLVVDNAAKAFRTPEGGAVKALDGVSIDIAPGEFFVMLGPSGCGKTTLLRSIAGLENLDAGTIHLDGERLDTVAPFARRVNTVFQSYALFPHMTVSENISFGLEMAGASRRSAAPRVSEMLALVHLEEMGSRKPHQLSGGQQQRVALARALATQPSVLLLDEPLAALDLKLRRGMQSELKRLQAATGITFVFVTHDQEEALALGDRIAVFNDGKIVQCGTPEDIYERPNGRFVADFIGEASFLNVSMIANLPDELFVNANRGAHVAVRPERVRFVAVSESHLSGVVVESQYAGPDVRLVVQLADGQMVRVRTTAGVPTPTVGGRADVAFSVGSLRKIEV